ncbi:hypothetical protein IV203_027511 [Nitzschia inconspicua]|uniref:Uncharacterized protein n=1 Tax=Nitzschia inconspicua TaxID=303405 RepID=A0A9K3LXV3_9STRA|nr:hypothetical protein IV203_027511 [Nitzschia inconspicua]
MSVAFFITLYSILFSASLLKTPLDSSSGGPSMVSPVGLLQERPVKDSEWTEETSTTIKRFANTTFSTKKDLYKSKSKGNVPITRKASLPPKKKSVVKKGRKPKNTAAVNVTNPIEPQETLNQFYRNNWTLPNGQLYQIDSTKLWNADPQNIYPQWMKDYLNWHDYQRQTWSRETFSQKRWMVMQCLKTQYNCGGTSDRLKPIVFQLKVAYLSRRILIIHWNKPHPLTEFLVPPRGGLDWRAPSWLAELIETAGLGRDVGKTLGDVLDMAMEEKSKFTMARMAMQDYHAGRFWYDEQVQVGEPAFETIFHHVWKLFFTPSAAVRQRLETSMSEMKLTPYSYTAAHCRVLYAKDDRPQYQQKNWAENAVNCASELRPRMPIFFTSDSTDATLYAQVYGKSRNATVMTRIPNPNPPLHIEFSGGKRRPASDYLDGFVDLYILAEATCVTYNKGGYGVFGLLMGRNATCGLRQDAMDRPKIHNPCHWVDDDPMTSSNENTRHHYLPPKNPDAKYDPIYLPPMDDTWSP